MILIFNVELFFRISISNYTGAFTLWIIFWKRRIFSTTNKENEKGWLVRTGWASLRSDAGFCFSNT